MHNGMVELGTEKMAKSVGNIRLLHGALDEYGPEAVVMWLVSGHYRQPLGFSEDALEQAAANVRSLRELIRRLEPGAAPADALDPLVERFFDALADDFNTARALGSLYDWIREANRREEGIGGSHLREMLDVLGLASLLEAAEGPPAAAVELAAQRAAAREARDWAEADRLRDELRAMGWEVRDGAAGPELVPAA
jgi:cysteinyl-tRNA synthetase